MCICSELDGFLFYTGTRSNEQLPFINTGFTGVGCVERVEARK